MWLKYGIGIFLGFYRILWILGFFGFIWIFANFEIFGNFGIFDGKIDLDLHAMKNCLKCE